ncbi:MAG: hypothetical protein Kow00108_07220 [Calditrichia bacterium]
MPRIISFIIQKGGCGKTTSTVNTGGYLSGLGIKTLLVDMDPQGNLTQHLGYNTDDIDKTVVSLMKNEASFDEVVLKRNEHLHILPNNILAASEEIMLHNSYTREYLLRDALYPVMNDYDFILIDCPPNLGLYSINSLATSTEFVLVVAPEFFPMKAIKPLFETYNMVRTKLNRTLKLGGVLLTMADLRTRHAQQVLQIIFKNFGKLLFQSFIRNNVHLKEAAAHGQHIFEYAPESIGALDYQSFADEFLKDHARVKEKLQYFDKMFQSLSKEEQEEIISFAQKNVHPFIQSRLDSGEDSSALSNAILIERNKILDKLFPYRLHADEKPVT